MTSNTPSNPSSSRPMTLRQQLEAIFVEYDKPSTTKTYPGQKTRVRRGAALDEIEALCQEIAREARLDTAQAALKACPTLDHMLRKWLNEHIAGLRAADNQRKEV